MSSKALLAHPGTQYSHQLARQLLRHACLSEFWTCFALSKDNWFTQVLNGSLPASWRKRIANRIIPDMPAKYLRTMATVEWKALNQINQGSSPQKALHKRNQAFQERIPTSSIQKAAAIIGFDTSSWIIGKRSRELGKPFFLDQSIAHPLVNQSTSQEVARCFPSWQKTLEPRLPEVLACENQEYTLATKIITASSYTKQTLISQGVAADKILVNPYGVDLRTFYPPLEPRTRQPLRFLFLGAISARKGVPLLLEAWRALALEDSELWLVGPITATERSIIPTLPGLKVMGKYPYEDLPDLLRQCDVLVFPSYCEGFGLVLLEALASGMPIITTEATAGPDLIQNGREGLLIPSGDMEALCQAIKYFIDNQSEIESMSKAARQCAERFSWDSYGDRWQKILQEYA